MHRDDGRSRAAGRSGGQDRERERSAGQEARLLAFERNQVRLGQDLEQIASLQRFDSGANVEVGPEHEQVQQVGEVDAGIGKLLALKLELAEARRLKLLRGGFTNTLGIPAEQVEPDLR